MLNLCRAGLCQLSKRLAWNTPRADTTLHRVQSGRCLLYCMLCSVNINVSKSINLHWTRACIPGSREKIISNAENRFFVCFNHLINVLKRARINGVFLPADAKDTDFKAGEVPNLEVLKSVSLEQREAIKAHLKQGRQSSKSSLFSLQIWSSEFAERYFQRDQLISCFAQCLLRASLWLALNVPHTLSWNSFLKLIEDNFKPSQTPEMYADA